MLGATIAVTVIYLALKYAREPEQGLIANTNLGGDNVHRGGVLGALLGAANGVEAWPSRWTQNLDFAPLAMKPVTRPNGVGEQGLRKN